MELMKNHYLRNLRNLWIVSISLLTRIIIRFLVKFDLVRVCEAKYRVIF